ncbi:stress-responsive transcription factor [Saccharomycopsis crataegensis]|uniref:Heat shock transcription factor n=1 Tax=Saccharomycopsis crataegensis TaxID=43959 RepID=A0AAV5QMJ2_9ASCO|nr:stress-responsive transcription factor [Saccharomycopsis crataegensis]
MSQQNSHAEPNQNDIDIDIDPIINSAELVLPEEYSQSHPFSRTNDTPLSNELQLVSPSTQYFGVPSSYVNMIDGYLALDSLDRTNGELKSSDLLKNVKKEMDKTQVIDSGSAPSNTLNSGKSKKAPSQPKSRPAFVMKLWLMVNDTNNFAHIQWSPDGKSFKVINRESFMKTILPKYFKHSNFSSFVRQLNMYGWHKVQDMNVGSNTSASDEIWQFENPNFQKNREDLLDNIVRNKSVKNGRDDVEELDVNLVVNELNKIKANQGLIADDLRRVRQDNSLLWQEVILARDRYNKQNETLNTILRFIASVFSGNSSSGQREIGFDGVNSNNPLLSALFDAVKKSNANNNNNSTVSDITSLTPTNESVIEDNINDTPTVSKPRLMLTDGAYNESPLVEEPATIRTLSSNPSTRRNSNIAPLAIIDELPNDIISPATLGSINSGISDPTSSNNNIDFNFPENDITNTKIVTNEASAINNDASRGSSISKVNGILSNITSTNEIVKSKKNNDATIESLHSNIIKQEESIGNLADLISRYIPDNDYDRALSPGGSHEFDVDQFLANDKGGLASTSDVSAINGISELPDSDKVSTKRGISDIDDEESNKTKMAKQ